MRVAFAIYGFAFNENFITVGYDKVYSCLLPDQLIWCLLVGELALLNYPIT